LSVSGLGRKRVVRNIFHGAQCASTIRKRLHGVPVATSNKSAANCFSVMVYAKPPDLAFQP
jgi:hypothetical protein